MIVVLAVLCRNIIHGRCLLPLCKDTTSPCVLLYLVVYAISCECLSLSVVAECRDYPSSSIAESGELGSATIHTGNRIGRIR
jgi:hypothetical protein